jgi:hypothetical protein
MFGLFVVIVDQVDKLVQDAKVEQIVLGVVFIERRDAGIDELEIVFEKLEV